MRSLRQISRSKARGSSRIDQKQGEEGKGGAPEPCVDARAMFSSAVAIQRLFTFRPGNLGCSAVPSDKSGTPGRLRLVFSSSNCPVIGLSGATTHIRRSPVTIKSREPDPDIPGTRSDLGGCGHRGCSLFRQFSGKVLLSSTN